MLTAQYIGWMDICMHGYQDNFYYFIYYHYLNAGNQYFTLGHHPYIHLKKPPYIHFTWFIYDIRSFR